MPALVNLLAERIHREGPIPYSAFVEAALYGDGGFFTRAHGAGRVGRDFITSPEVGPLFGALVAGALDGWWDALERPDPYLFVDAGAGRGRVVADVLAAQPRCAGALRCILVERSAALREAQRDLLVLEPFEDAWGPIARAEDDSSPTAVAGMGPIVTSLPELPAISASSVVLANELLDNLPFRVAERRMGSWHEVRVGVRDATFEEVLVPASTELALDADLVAAGVPMPDGARVPVPLAIKEWMRRAAAIMRRGVLVVVDYTATADEILSRGYTGWLRTYREHQRGGDPLEHPGEQDITIDLPLEYVRHAAERSGLRLHREITQAEWLHELGVDALVAQARAEWNARAHVGDLDALRHRSRVTEAAALTDPAGLGAHRVLVFAAGAHRSLDN